MRLSFDNINIQSWAPKFSIQKDPLMATPKIAGTYPRK